MTDLHSQLAPVAKIPPRKSKIPVLECLRIGGGQAVATDLDMEVAAQIPELDSEPVCVPAKPLMAALAAVGNGRLAVTDDKAIVSGDRGEIKIGLVKDEGWPEMAPVVSESYKPVRVSTSARDALARLLPTVCRDGIRHYLNGIAFVDGHAVSTDRHRLRSVPMRQANGAGKDIILGYAAARWVAAMKGDFDLDVGAKGFTFANDYVKACGRTIDGTYVDWRRAIRSTESAPTRAVFSAEDMREALMAVVPFAEGRGKGVKLTIEGGKIAIETKQIILDIEARAEINAATSGDRFSVGFNGKYLLDMIGRAPATVAMVIGAPDDPCRFVFDGSDDIVVLMPMRV